MQRHGGNVNEAKAVYESYKANKNVFIPDARFEFAMFINDLQNSGYPAESLSKVLKMEQWNYLSELKNALNKYYSEK